LYERGNKIEARLKRLITLLLEGKYSAIDLSQKMNTSIATVSRDIEALRQRDFDIQAVRDKEGWRYKLIATERQLELGLRVP